MGGRARCPQRAGVRHGNILARAAESWLGALRTAMLRPYCVPNDYLLTDTNTPCGPEVGRADTTDQDSSRSPHAKYFPPRPVFGIGPGTIMFTIGKLRNFCARVRSPAGRGVARNVSTSAPLITKSLLPNVGRTGFGSRNSSHLETPHSGSVVLEASNCAGRSCASSVSRHETKTTAINPFAFIIPATLGTVALK